MDIQVNRLADTALLEKGAQGGPASLSQKMNGEGLAADRGVFGNTLHQVETDRLLDELDVVAEQLFRFPSDKVLNDYRQVVGKILGRAEEMISIRMDYSVRSGSARVVIDRARRSLDELDRVLRREGNRSRIMGLTEDIRGCIVSLVV